MNCIFLCLHLFTASVIAEETKIEMIYNNKVVNETFDISAFHEEIKDPLFYNSNYFDEWANKLNRKIYVAPKNAQIKNDGSIQEEEIGLGLNIDQFERNVRDILYDKPKSKKINIPTKKLYPRVTSELLSQINEQRLGSYVTSFKKSNKERTHNIELATNAIDNYVVFPNESFSFNEVVGQRTKEKGYKEAPIIVKGEISEGIGGGICQVSSTLFNAVNLKGIEITERYTHSRPVEYVPKGKDATVSWWGPDFVFKNVYRQPILIKAKAVNGQMMIDIYGADDLM